MPIALVVGLLALVPLWVVARCFVSARASVAGIIAGLLVATLASWLVAPGLLVPSPAVPSGLAIGWELPLGVGPSGRPVDPLTPETTVIPVVVDHPGCTSSSGGDWLGEPAIAYTPWSVTITMHIREDVAQSPRCAGCHHMSMGDTEGYFCESGGAIVGNYLSGEGTQVQLSQPLGGRQLFDGSKSPPHRRSQTDTPSTMSR